MHSPTIQLVDLFVVPGWISPPTPTAPSIRLRYFIFIKLKGPRDCPGGEFSFLKQYCTLFVWGDLEREQISVFDLNSDEINRSVHYVHHILEQKKKKSWN